MARPAHDNEPDPDVDARFSLANERTALAWIRTALATVAAGLAAAKGLRFDHEVVRWIVSAPPVLAGAVLAGRVPAQWRERQDALTDGHPFPLAGPRLNALGVALAGYAVVALVAVALD